MTDLKPVHCPHPPEVVEGIKQLTEAFRRLAPIVKAAVGGIVSFYRKVWDAAKQADIPPKWIHLGAHAKKARVRKKYRALCALRVADALLNDMDL